MHAACDLSTPEALFRSLTRAELNIHTISSASILNRLSPGIISLPGPPSQTYTFKPEAF
jgi:hypothetical protein